MPASGRPVFTNLIGNAITYTPAGGSVSITAQARNDRGVSVAHRDTPGRRGTPFVLDFAYAFGALQPGAATP